MSYHGDIALGNTIDFNFTTRQISGAPTTLAGVPVLSAYVGNSTTELTAGITLTVDFDARTGMNHVRVVATSGNGYATATDVDIVITTGTVNSVSVVGEVVGSFSIENRSALRPATASRTLVVDAAGLADANMVKCGPTGSGTAQTARDLGASVLVAGDLSATMKTSVTTAATAATPTIAGYTGDTPQTGDAYLALTAATTELAQGAPSITASILTQIKTIYKFAINKKTQTASQFNVYNSDNATIDHKSAVADDGTTASKAKIASGP